MPLPRPASPDLHGTGFFAGEGASLTIRAAGTSAIFGESEESGPPPAATERAQTAFESMGLILLGLMALLAAWILIRGRL